jgi:hypothetical protein
MGGRQLRHEFLYIETLAWQFRLSFFKNTPSEFARLEAVMAVNIKITILGITKFLDFVHRLVF